MVGLKLKIIYAGTDITADVSAYCTGVTFTDALTGKSDELELSFDDSDALWRSAWNPQKGDELQVQIGYEGIVMDCGSFDIDEIEYSGPPDQVRLKGLSTGVKQGYRTQVTKWHQNRSLGALAKEIAGKHGLKVVGAPSGISMVNVYQPGVDDLRFLRTLAERYGYSFKIARGCLVFFRVSDFEAMESVAVLTRDLVSEYSFRTSGAPVCKSIELAYFDPKAKRRVSGSASNTMAVVGERVRLDMRCSQASELSESAGARMAQRKRDEDEMSVSMIGDPRLIAGVMVTIKGFGVFDRDYLVDESVHRWSRDQGYATELKLKRKSA